jgi:hypothetical protein
MGLHFIHPSNGCVHHPKVFAIDSITNRSEFIRTINAPYDSPVDAFRNGCSWFTPFPFSYSHDPHKLHQVDLPVIVHKPSDVVLLFSDAGGFFEFMWTRDELKQLIPTVGQSPLMESIPWCVRVTRPSFPDNFPVRLTVGVISAADGKTTVPRVLRSEKSNTASPRSITTSSSESTTTTVATTPPLYTTISPTECTTVYEAPPAHVHPWLARAMDIPFEQLSLWLNNEQMHSSTDGNRCYMVEYRDYASTVTTEASPTEKKSEREKCVADWLCQRFYAYFSSYIASNDGAADIVATAAASRGLDMYTGHLFQTRDSSSSTVGKTYWFVVPVKPMNILLDTIRGCVVPSPSPLMKLDRVGARVTPVMTHDAMKDTLHVTPATSTTSAAPANASFILTVRFKLFNNVNRFEALPTELDQSEAVKLRPRVATTGRVPPMSYVTPKPRTTPPPSITTTSGSTSYFSTYRA